MKDGRFSSHPRQLELKGIPTIKDFVKANPYIRIRSFQLHEGLHFIRNVKPKEVDGHRIEGLRGSDASIRIKLLKHGEVRCAKCGLVGSVFYIERHRNDLESVFKVNLYGVRPNGKEIMMTHDHIIPKSLDGADNQDNAQIMCQSCNHSKGNFLSLHEMIEISKRDKILFMFRAHFQRRPLHEIIGSVQKDTNKLIKELRDRNLKLRRDAEKCARKLAAKQVQLAQAA